MEQLKQQQEYFALSLKIDDSRIPVGDLVDYLHNTEKLFKSINESLEPGEKYDKVELDVLALEKGSFTIAFLIIKTIIGPFALGVLASLVANLLTNKITSKQEKSLLDNENIVKSVVNILNIMKNDPRIHGFTLTYDTIDGKRETISITKEMLSETLNAYHREFSLRIWLKRNVTLKIDSVFGAKVKGMLEDGEWITAEITDAQFLDTMSSLSFMLYMMDSIDVDLECVLKQEKNEKIIDLKYYIRNVQGYHINESKAYELLNNERLLQIYDHLRNRQ